MNQNSPFSQRSTPLEGARVKASLEGFSTKIQSLNNNSSETLQLIKSQLLVNESVVKGIESMKEEIKEAEG